MDVTKTGNISHNRTAAIDEVIQGREATAQLGAILEEVLPTSRDLMKEISDSFSQALVALENEERSRKIRKKCNNLTRTIVAPTLNDGHFWRKYGQKKILNSEFPRGYYRCICKHDQKCLATRQVQQSKDNPSLFTIKYFGEHTCQDLDSPERTSCMIDFKSSTTTCSATLTPRSSSSVCNATQEMDTLDESESGQFLVELMEASGNGDEMSFLQPLIDHDPGCYFMGGSFHENGYLFGL